MLSFVIFFKLSRIIIAQTLYFLYQEKITMTCNVSQTMHVDITLKYVNYN